jgi:hypothetical protein
MISGWFSVDAPLALRCNPAAYYTPVAVAKLKQIHEATHPAWMEHLNQGTPADLES